MHQTDIRVARRRFLATSAAFLAAPTFGRAADEPAPSLPKFDEELKRSLDDAPLKMLFKGSTPAELAAWQKEFAAELRRLIGPHTPPAEWTSERISTRELNDHTREEFLLKADGVPSLPLYVLRPRAKNVEKFPILLALHGHGMFGHDAIVGHEAIQDGARKMYGPGYDYGRQMVSEGYLVVVPCFTPFGRRISGEQMLSKTDICAVAFVKLMLLGQTLLGANLRDVLWSLDFTSQRNDALPDRVGCIGLSYGGRMTLVAAALDHRIKAAVISGGMNVFQERATGKNWSCGAQIIPGLLEFGDTPEIGSLIAPRPAVWEVGSRDLLIPPAWADRAIARLKGAYDASESPDNLGIFHFEGGHLWKGTTAVPMLAKHLKGTA